MALMLTTLTMTPVYANPDYKTRLAPEVLLAAAKAALFFGLAFYIVTTFILKVDIHFVHIWGIEFVLNMLIMFGVSHFSSEQPRAYFEGQSTRESCADGKPSQSSKQLAALAEWDDDAQQRQLRGELKAVTVQVLWYVELSIEREATRPAAHALIAAATVGQSAE